MLYYRYKGYNMKNYTLPLPEKLHNSYGHQPKIEFEMRHRHYYLNGETFDNPLKNKFGVGFKGFMFSIQNKCVLVTLFYSKDILRRV